MHKRKCSNNWDWNNLYVHNHPCFISLSKTLPSICSLSVSFTKIPQPYFSYLIGADLFLLCWTGAQQLAWCSSSASLPPLSEQPPPQRQTDRGTSAVNHAVDRINNTDISSAGHYIQTNSTDYGTNRYHSFYSYLDILFLQWLCHTDYLTTAYHLQMMSWKSQFLGQHLS